MVIYALAYLLPLTALAAAGLGLVRGVKHVRGYRYRRAVIRPVEAAVINILRTRVGVTAAIPPELVGASRPGPRGSITLPMDWSGADGDRDRLAVAVRERLSIPEASFSYDMAGATPTMNIYIPKTAPAMVTWDEALDRWSPTSPYLGQSASGAVHWELGEDSPHIGVPGGAGSGKSELMARIVAQFMRGGAGIVVLDPKGTSHRWLLDLSQAGDRGVLYCSERAMQFDVVMWLDSVMDDRIVQNRRAGQDIEFPRIVVLLEERNSLQDRLRDAWDDRRVPPQRALSPAIRALDRLSSMGRSLNINIILGSQATAQVDVGKKNNYGAWAIAGRMADNHWKNIGARRPGISSKPGRFGYVVAGSVTVFQAVFCDMKAQPGRLTDWATAGEDRLDVVGLSSSPVEGVAFPSWEAETTDGEGSGGLWEAGQTTLVEWARKNEIQAETVRAWSRRYEDFPQVVGTIGRSRAYEEEKLDRWHTENRGVAA